MEDSNLRLQKIAEFVKTRQMEMYLKREDRDEFDRRLVGTDYRWKHTLRVSHWGKVLAEAEGTDVELVVAACLLHDVSSFDVMANDNDHGRVGAAIARPMLIKLGYPPAQVESICTSVAEHADIAEPSTLEARVVADADNMDRFSAFRVLVWCQPNVHDFDLLVADLTKRIAKLERYQQKSPMLTETGKNLFANQLDFQINFYRKILGESEETRLPVI